MQTVVFLACPDHTIELVSRETSRNLESPNYPNVFPPNMTCSWNMLAPAGNRIYFFITEYSIEANGDYLQVRGK